MTPPTGHLSFMCPFKIDFKEARMSAQCLSEAAVPLPLSSLRALPVFPGIFASSTTGETRLRCTFSKKPPRVLDGSV